MELKYYLRGLGLGIIVTAVIMGVAHSGKQTMTDEQVRARARQLGMIEDTVLAAESGANTDVLQEIPESGQTAASEEVPDRTGEIPNTDISELETDAEGPETTDDADNTESKMTEGEETEPDEDNAAEDMTDNDADTAANSDDRTVTPDDEETGENSSSVSTDNTDRTSSTGNTLAVSGGSVSITIYSGEGSDTASRKLAAAGAVSSASAYDSFLCANGYDKRIQAGTYTIPLNASDEQIARIITGQE